MKQTYYSEVEIRRRQSRISRRIACWYSRSFRCKRERAETFCT